jgi:hypothetical protein
MQPERDLMAHAALFSLPDKAVVQGADAEPRLRADDRQDLRLRSAEAQIEAAHSASDRGCERLVDHDPPARFHVLDGEYRAIWQEPDREPGAIDDPGEAKIVLARRRQDLCWRARHGLSFD